MRVNYLGPLCGGISHPALEGYDLTYFTPSCYLVEVSDEAGVEGPVIEGDVLVVDESRVAQHADLVVVEREGLRLFNSHRIGGQIRLIPPMDRSGSFPARQSDIRGVVVRQARRYGL
ncbi:hypothetical protein [Halomonas urumqiensis]|uniref:Peptidase S24/S26A/S26B/S26C domain-containing protein n=1 Tax=Halomonas urumqiensis TaxID=1684789 RepID=A0A2N7UDJ9_9GAMM|nr:hypothetical protein [Halomonas urumqiensis]PMR78513.1 hypothetical protein C1H70_17375 [Halomonas urumqiensis]PTB03658.1 hypothetical protein C6V82_04005 [Halomonas urumqiensis]GHE20132.1 hypothetical protein GCM10017767_06530 [Halomonas urumqiensis]